MIKTTNGLFYNSDDSTAHFDLPKISVKTWPLNFGLPETI